MKIFQQFFEEKMRLEEEANNKLKELADRAHTEAVNKLQETSKNVYRDNISMSKALQIHIKESDKLKADFQCLEKTNTKLKQANEFHAATQQKQILETKASKKETKNLRLKMNELETVITNMVEEFAEEKSKMEDRLVLETSASKEELKRLEKIIQVKDQENNRIKIVARNIVEQRSDLETFFHQALAQVRNEIKASRQLYIAAAKESHNKQMMLAFSGKGKYPSVRNFNQGLVNSTNNVSSDFKIAEITSNLQGQKGLSDLTWEQKEKVLKLLFAKINQQVKQSKNAKYDSFVNQKRKQKINENSGKLVAKLMESEELPEKEEIIASTTFITEGNSLQQENQLPVLPAINTS